ncbi:P-loop containing nucleoside triphosphate hydrolase protein [Exidia glandulosa HHB12029]|uniref:p-loop containing nucleoside triphosphate hydrolase protein n=1 Tax=Exidia glandulosa HHB12029 TaxID=1314781 RepID=A0A165NBD2_EXIGL|nr:P-loop containing nucleoside triphosphate hydrolase protein [Exidia glandulosa HHB12029]
MPMASPSRQSQASKPSYFEWHNLSFEIAGKKILDGVSGHVAAGELLAVCGPSGAGKSTFLDVMAQRTKPTDGYTSFNGELSPDMQELSSYVEQHDALLGVLTVRETLLFAAKLSFPPSTSSAVIQRRVEDTIAQLGLSRVADNRIGTPIQRGVSGGQRRRVSIGVELVRLPRILLLDEPTSGLDSAASREIIRTTRDIARRYGMLVIATIHQPSYETLALFDRVLLLARGQTAFFGATSSLVPYLRDVLKSNIGEHSNPAERALDLLNDDFNMAESRDQGDEEKAARDNASVPNVLATWREFSRTHPAEAYLTLNPSPNTKYTAPDATFVGADAQDPRWHAQWYRPIHQTGVLMHRAFLNYTRNLLAYGVRIGMYVGMGVLLATVWVNLGTSSSKINDRLSVHFFSVAFLGFMSVAGIPAFLEERHVFMRERLNGLYGVGPYVVSNSLASAPFLFICSLVFTIISYWSIGLHPGGEHFFKFLAVLYLAVYTAESQSLLVAAGVPIFVAALAIASFLNGFWMCVQGYFIRAVNLPAFWRVWAHWIDYETHAFNFLVINDLRGLVFECSNSSGQCHCEYASSLIASGRCEVSGEDVLKTLDITELDAGTYVAILFCIAIVYRILLFVVLYFKRR